MNIISFSLFTLLFSLFFCSLSLPVLSINGIAQRLTKDHVASCDEERERIESVGGRVEFGRVADADGDGVLQVSRGIGNWYFAWHWDLIQAWNHCRIT